MRSILINEVLLTAYLRMSLAKMLAHFEHLVASQLRRATESRTSSGLYPNMAGVLATAGNLVFLGHYDGTFAAYDAKTLQEMSRFNVGSPIQASPVRYSVNGKQYITIVVGARMWAYIMQNAPELKNPSTTSMLYVLGL
jgi:PQQ-like domain